MHDDFININMVTSPVGALDCCHIWNHLFLTCCFNFATFLCIWRYLKTWHNILTFLWFIAWTFHCKAVKTWLSRVENTAKVCDFVLCVPFTPLFFWRSASFFAEFSRFWNRLPQSIHTTRMTTAPVLWFFLVFSYIYIRIYIHMISSKIRCPKWWFLHKIIEEVCRMESRRKKVECSIKYVRKKRGSLSVAPNTN